MNDLLDKLSNYDILNHVIPGSIYLIGLDYLNGTDFMGMDIAYFILLSFAFGIIIGRIGSLVLQKLLYKFTKEAGEPYEEYIKASRKDKKIVLLESTKKEYRNIMSMFITLLLSSLLLKLIKIINIRINLAIYIFIILLVILFGASTLKTNSFIIKRIKATNDEGRKE